MKAYTLDLSDLSAGIYILELTTEDQIVRRKIVKQ
jgi:hypothetical protein